MSNSSLTSALLALSLLSLPMGSQARAQAGSASCDFVEVAVAKQITGTFHANVTMTGLESMPGTVKGEIISTAGITYFTHDGKWAQSPLTPQENLAQHKSTVSAMKTHTCKKLPDERVGAAEASVYSVHSESDVGTTNSKLWLARSGGAVLRSEDEVLSGGASAPLRISTTYDYANVKAPALTN
jgi:hypothetical protein